jgi:outer membrane autotransporter protein
MKLYKFSMLSSVIRMVLLFSGVNFNAVANSLCSSSDKTITINSKETNSCHLSFDQSLIINNGAYIEVSPKNKTPDLYGLNVSAVSVGEDDDQTSIISAEGIENNGILSGLIGVVVTYSGHIKYLINHNLIEGINVPVWVAGYMEALDNYGSIISTDPSIAAPSIWLSQAEGNNSQGKSGRIDNITNHKNGSIEGISIGYAQLGTLNNHGKLTSIFDNALLVTDGNVNTLNNYGTLYGIDYGIRVNGGGYLEHIDNKLGSHGITADQDAINVVGSGSPYGDTTQKNRASKIEKITNAASIYGKQNGIFIDDQGVINTITNETSGVIQGGKFAINNNGIINSIKNAGTIIGDIVLGNAHLIISGPKSVLNGDVKASKGAIVDIKDNADFTYTHTMTGIDSVNIDKGSALRLGYGNTVGDISKTIKNDGVLYFNRDNTVTDNHIISGTGVIHLVGTGMTKFNSDYSSFTGSTNIEGGTLVVDGKLGSMLNVENSGTLEGTGTIGGTATIEKGGLLVGKQGKTLAFGNDLILNKDAHVNVSLGASNTSLPALFSVAGDLTLDGIMHVSEYDNFSAGIYEIFRYNGKLNYNDMTLTSGKSNSPFLINPNLSIDPYTPNTIYLVNTGGMALNYWDGGNVAKHNDGVVDGGNGVWLIGGNDNWTSNNGLINLGWQNTDQFAIFQGSAGKVEIDNSGGDITVNALQFRTPGYTLTGAPLTLSNNNGSAKINVDMSNQSTAITTIDSILQGKATLEKTGTGPLILTGENTYSGGTTISGGMLQLGNGGATGNINGDVAIGDKGTLVFNRSNNITFDNKITGRGNIIKKGANTLALAGNNNYTGTIDIQQGTLYQSREGAFSAGSSYIVAQNSVLNLGGIKTTVSTLNNSGTVVFDGNNNTIGRILTIAGSYNSNNGTVKLSTVLDGDNSATDQLIVKGAASGKTDLVINNIGGKGAVTKNGIKVINIQGTSTATFNLIGDYQYKGEPAIVAGAYAYRLSKNEGEHTGESWYLYSSIKNQTPTNNNPSLYHPGVSVYEAYGRTLQLLNTPGTLHNRVNQYGNGLDYVRNENTGQLSNGTWGQITGYYGRLSPRMSTSETDNVAYKMVRAQTGINHHLYENNHGVIIGGVFLQYSNVDADMGSMHGEGNIRANGYTAGTTATWYGHNGVYWDGLVQLSYFSNNLYSKTANRSLGDNKDALGYALSLETGKQIDLTPAWSLTPQLQLTYSAIHMKDFNDSFDVDIRFKQSQNLQLLVGTTIDYRQKWRNEQSKDEKTANFYGLFNIRQELLKNNDSVDVASVHFKSSNGRTWGEAGVGSAYSWDNDQYLVYTQASVNTNLSNSTDNYEISGKIGLRMRW